MPVNVSFVSTMTMSNKTDGPIVLRYPEFVCAKGMSSVEFFFQKILTILGKTPSPLFRHGSYPGEGTAIYGLYRYVPL